MAEKESVSGMFENVANLGAKLRPGVGWLRHDRLDVNMNI